MIEVDITVKEVKAAQRMHECDYCKAKIGRNTGYTCITSRLKTERFPVTIKICSSHSITLIPLGILLDRSKK